MEQVRRNLRNLFNKAAAFPVAALLCLILLVLGVYFVSGFISGTFERSRAKKEYEAKTAQNLKALQVAIIEADKARRRSENAETEARAIMEANSKRAETLSKKDAATDQQIAEVQQRGKAENEKIENNYVDSIRRVSIMDDNERAADVCSRLAELAATNPAFAGISCQAEPEPNAAEN